MTRFAGDGPSAEEISMTARPHHLVDAVCGMTVDVAKAEEIKVRLDEERAAAAAPTVGAGICEVAEAGG